MEAIVLLIVFGTTAFIAYLFLSARHKERMAIIENDKDISILRPAPKTHASWALKIGLLLFFAGAGIILGYFFSYIFKIPEDVTIPSFLFMFAGGGLLTYYGIAKRLVKQESEHV